MKVKFSNRLSFRLAVNIILLTLFLGLLMSFVQVLLMRQDQKTVLNNEFRAIMSISQTPASQIAYNIDTRLADDLLKGLLEHPAIISAEIIDSDNQILSKQQQPPAVSPYRWISDTVFQPARTLTKELHVPQLPNFRLGTLNVVVDTFPLGSQFVHRAIFTLMSGFIKAVILSAVLLLLFYLMLTRPLIKVIGAVTKVDPETPEKVRLPVPSGHKDDEIGLLIHSTNNQLQAIEGNLEKLKAAESRLRTYSEELEEIVHNRTKEISEKNQQLLKSNEDLQITKEEAVKAGLAKADFLANMSHEIRTPFNGVLGMISLTLEEPLSEKQKEQLNVAYSSGFALLEILNDILDISKVEAGKLTLENISFDLRKTVEDVVSLLAQTAHAKQVELYPRVAASFPERIFGDPTRIRQVISNLVSNAIKFTEQGYVSVYLSMAGEQGVEVRVKDTGTGIGAEFIDSIFTPFSQGDAQTTRKFGGTGLGLTICNHLVNQMGGTIGVDSEVGKGSTFSTLLPLSPDDSAVPPATDPRLQHYHYVLIHKPGNQSFSSIGELLNHWHLHSEEITYQDLHHLLLKQHRFSKNTIVLFDSRSVAPLLAEHPDISRLTLVMVTRDNIHVETKVLQMMKINKLISAPVSRDKLYETLCKTTRIYDSAPEPDISTEQKTATTYQCILLVEDNQINQILAKAILKTLGYDVTIANNGKEAIDKLNNNHFSIILMDCHMPVMDGYEATRKIRQTAKFDSLPIVALTANVMQGDKEKCLACGMNDYLTKPYQKKALAAILEKWLV